MTQNIQVTYKGQVVEYAIVDPEDFDKANKYTWHCSRNKYAISNNNTRMHHLILGKPEKGFVVDHINGNAFDNRKCNLRFATFQQNAQNKAKKENGTSKYIGVFKKNNNKKYTARFSNICLGNFENEEDAAKQYDIYVYLTLGENSRTNNLITYEESQKYKLEDILLKKRKICNNIFYYKNRYFGEIMYNRKKFTTKFYVNKEDAENQLKIIKEDIEKLKAIEKEKHNSREISYDENDNAIIQTNKGINIIVDKIYWHKLMEYKWSINGNQYVGGRCNKKIINMHQYIYELHHGNIPELIDHVNKNKLDNRIENLAEKTSSHNNHNRTKLKNASSKYYGVSYGKANKTWQSEITKDGKRYYLGRHKNEIDAAIAYNNKATELYGDNANLNIIT